MGISTIPKGVFRKRIATVSRTANSGCSLIPASGSTKGFMGMRRQVPMQVRLRSISSRRVTRLETNVVMRARTLHG